MRRRADEAEPARGHCFGVADGTAEDGLMQWSAPPCTRSPDLIEPAEKGQRVETGLQTTSPPAASEERTAAIRPWMWKSGMMLRQRSRGQSARVAPICAAEAARLACERAPASAATSCPRCGEGGRRRRAAPGRRSPPIQAWLRRSRTCRPRPRYIEAEDCDPQPFGYGDRGAGLIARATRIALAPMSVR